ncbi:MAG: nucleotidyltransferase substrate binding protein [Thermaerobacter sp.]|nr:nucleotidyltransferase substrate binding protein [Thermaerobacter sp.]
MSDQDVRWTQRLAHFDHALDRLREAKRLADSRPLSDLEQQGMIKAFEFTYELAWNVLKDFLEYQGTQGLYGSRDVVRTAFKVGLIQAGEVWMDMIGDRNQSAHMYDEKTANRILTAIREEYLPQFETLIQRMQDLRDEEKNS